MIRLIVIIVFLKCLSGHSQSDFFVASDSLNRSRLIGVSSSVGATWTGSMTGLWYLWYKDANPDGWHTIDDSRNWLQMDKAGHFYTAYKINASMTNLYEWTGLNRKQSVLIGSGISFGFQTTLEIFDARFQQWGFSWSDFGANTLGVASYATQKLVWDEERIIPKFSTHPTEFARYRPEILGGTQLQSLLKDYNGQTYWLSFSPGTFFQNSQFPEWLCFSFGYSAHEKLVGDQSIYVDPVSGRTFNEQREFLFSMDVDFSKLKIRRPWLKTLVNQLNYIKVPFPTIILRDGKVIGSPLYF